jgi:hypothetical protein
MADSLADRTSLIPRGIGSAHQELGSDWPDSDDLGIAASRQCEAPPVKRFFPRSTQVQGMAITETLHAAYFGWRRSMISQISFWQ